LGGPFSGSSWRFLGLKPLKKTSLGTPKYLDKVTSRCANRQPDLTTLRDVHGERRSTRNIPKITVGSMTCHHDLKFVLFFFYICISYWVVVPGPHEPIVSTRICKMLSGIPMNFRPVRIRKGANSPTPKVPWARKTYMFRGFYGKQPGF